MSETYTVVLPGNIEPHFNTRLERDAFIEWMHGLQQRLHDAEVALAAWMEWKKVQEADRVALTDALTAAQARIAALEAGLEFLVIDLSLEWAEGEWAKLDAARALLSPAPEESDDRLTPAEHTAWVDSLKRQYPGIPDTPPEEK